MTTSSSRSTRPSCWPGSRACSPLRAHARSCWPARRWAASSPSTGPRGVGTTTIAINAAIALHRELGRKVALVDGNLQFGDHRVFLDLGLDKKSIVDIVTAPSIDADLVRQVMVKHDSRDRPAAGSAIARDRRARPPRAPARDHRPSSYGRSTTTSCRRRQAARRREPGHLRGGRHGPRGHDRGPVVPQERPAHPRDDGATLGTVATRSSSCSTARMRSPGINVKNAEGALKRTIDHQVVNEYRGAISALELGLAVHVHQGRFAAGQLCSTSPARWTSRPPRQLRPLTARWRTRRACRREPWPDKPQVSARR